MFFSYRQSCYLSKEGIHVFAHIHILVIFVSVNQFLITGALCICAIYGVCDYWYNLLIFRLCSGHCCVLTVSSSCGDLINWDVIISNIMFDIKLIVSMHFLNIINKKIIIDYTKITLWLEISDYQVFVCSCLKHGLLTKCRHVTFLVTLNVWVWL